MVIGGNIHLKLNYNPVKNSPTIKIQNNTFSWIGSNAAILQKN